MANERRNLVREIRKALCELPSDELFLIAKNIEQIVEREESQVELGDEEGCFDFVSVFLCCKSLMGREDEGMSVLLDLRDKISQITQSQNIAAQKDKTHDKSTGQAQGNPDRTTPDTNTTTSHTHTYTADTEYQQMLKMYEELGRKIQATNTPCPHHPALSYFLFRLTQLQAVQRTRCSGGNFHISQGGSLESMEVRLVTPPLRLASTAYADKLKRVFTNTLVRVKSSEGC